NELFQHMADEDGQELIREGWEKLLMIKIHDVVFGAPGTNEYLMCAHLQRKVEMYGWIEERHLDLPFTITSSLHVAQEELTKIANFRSPRDKLTILQNTIQIVADLIKKASGKEATNDFLLPVLILVIIRSGCANIISHIKYIMRFRNPAELEKGETQFYLTNMMGAVSFVYNMDLKSLTLSPEEESQHAKKPTSPTTKSPTAEQGASSDQGQSQQLHVSSPTTAPTSTPSPNAPSADGTGQEGATKIAGIDNGDGTAGGGAPGGTENDEEDNSSPIPVRPVAINDLASQVYHSTSDFLGYVFKEVKYLGETAAETVDGFVDSVLTSRPGGAAGAPGASTSSKEADVGPAVDSAGQLPTAAMYPGAVPVPASRQFPLKGVFGGKGGGGTGAQQPQQQQRLVSSGVGGSAGTGEPGSQGKRPYPVQQPPSSRPYPVQPQPQYQYPLHLQQQYLQQQQQLYAQQQQQAAAPDFLDQAQLQQQLEPPNTFERTLSNQDRELLEDYEMQLAIALSLSMEAEKQAQAARSEVAAAALLAGVVDVEEVLEISQNAATTTVAHGTGSEGKGGARGGDADLIDLGGEGEAPSATTHSTGDVVAGHGASSKPDHETASTPSPSAHAPASGGGGGSGTDNNKASPSSSTEDLLSGDDDVDLAVMIAPLSVSRRGSESKEAVGGSAEVGTGGGGEKEGQ
ncbi:hypothetical protein HK102_001067, partial [Quaeritorhiza haematococci]